MPNTSQDGNGDAQSTENELSVMGATLPKTEQQPTAPTGATGSSSTNSPLANAPQLAGVNNQGETSAIAPKPKTAREAAKSISDFSIKANTYKDLQQLQQEKMQDPDIANFLNVAAAADKGEAGAEQEVARLAQNPKIHQGIQYIQEMQGKLGAMGIDLQNHQDEIQKAQEDLQGGKLDDEKPKSLSEGLKKSYYGGFANFYKGAVTLENAIGKAIHGKDYEPVTVDNSNALKLQYANEAAAKELQDAPNTTAGSIVKGIGGLPSMVAGLLAVPETKVPQFVAYMGAGGAIKGLQDQQDKEDASGVKTSLLQDLPAAAKEGLKGTVDGALMELSMGGSKYFNGIYKPIVSGAGVGGYEAVKSKILNGEVNLQDVISNAVLAGGMGFAHLDGVHADEPLNAENVAKAKNAINMLKEVQVDPNTSDAIMSAIGHNVQTIGDIDKLSDHDKALIINDPNVDKYTREKVMTVEAGKNLGQSPEQTFFSVPDATLKQVMDNPLTAEQARKQAEDLRSKTTEDPHEAEQNNLAATALDKMADIKEVSAKIAENPDLYQQHLDEAQDITPEERNSYKQRIEQLRPTKVPQEAIDPIEQEGNHISEPVKTEADEQQQTSSEQNPVSEARPAEPIKETNTSETTPNEKDGQKEVAKPLLEEANTHTEVQGKFSNNDEYVRAIARESINPVEVAQAWQTREIGNRNGDKESVIAANISPTTRKSFERFGDKNNLRDMAQMRMSWLRKEGGMALDKQAEAMSTDGMPISEQDLIDFIHKYPNGRGFQEIIDPHDKLLRDRFKELTGKNLTDATAAEITDAHRNVINNDYIDTLSDTEVAKLLADKKLQDELAEKLHNDFYKQPPTVEKNNNGENGDIGKKTPEPVSGSKSTETTVDKEPKPPTGGGQDKPVDEGVSDHGNSLKEQVWKKVFGEMLDDTETPTAKRSIKAIKEGAESALKENPDAGKEAVAKLQEEVQSTDVEKALVLKEGVEARKEYNRIYQELRDVHLSGDKTKESELKTEWARNKDYLEEINRARNNAASTASANLRIFQGVVDDNFDLAKMETEKRLAKGRPLTDKEFDLLKIQHEQLQKAHAEMERVMQEQKDLYEGKIKEVDRLKEQLHSEAQRGLERKAQKAKKAIDLEDIQQRKQSAIDAIKQVAKERASRLNSDATGVSAIAEYGKPIADLAKAYIDGGVVHLEDIANNIKNDIKDFADDISLDDIKTVISQELAKTDPRVKAALKRWEGLAKKYEQKAANKDFKPEPKIPHQYTKEAVQAKANYQFKKKLWEIDLAKDKLEHRTTFSKGADLLADWGRAALLATGKVFAKLAAAGAWTAGAINPLSRLIGAGIGKAIPKFAERVQYGSDFNIRVEAKAIVDGIKSIAESPQIWRTHMANIDLLDAKHDPAKNIVRGLSGIVGALHYIVKNPIQNATFSASLQYRLRHIAKHGGDIHSPLEQWVAINGALADNATESVRQRAIQDGKQSIFSEDNAAVTAINGFINKGGEIDRKTGELKYGKAGKALQTIGKEIMPVTKIPTNVVWQTVSDYMFGSLTGASELRKAYKAGWENLEPKEAEVIMRQLSKGSIGAAAMIFAGIVASKEDPDNTIGGNYQKGVKNPNAKAGDVVVNGHTVPKLLLHNPVFLAMNAASTAVQVAKSIAPNSEEERGGISGAIAALLTTAGEVPFVESAEQVSKMVGGSPEERSKAGWELLLSRLIPGILPEIAKATDKDENGDLVKRNPTTVGEHFKMELPTEAGRKSVPSTEE